MAEPKNPMIGNFAARYYGLAAGRINPVTHTHRLGRRSELGQSETSTSEQSMSVRPSTADVGQGNGLVSFVPQPDSCTAASKPCTD